MFDIFLTFLLRCWNVKYDWWGHVSLCINYTWESQNLVICKLGLSVCLFVSNKRQNGWTHWAQIFWGILRDPREGLWMIKFSKICLHQNSIFENIKNPLILFIKFANFFVFVLHCLQRKNVYNWNRKFSKSLVR